MTLTALQRAPFRSFAGVFIHESPAAARVASSLLESLTATRVCLSLFRWPLVAARGRSQSAWRKRRFILPHLPCTLLSLLSFPPVTDTARYQPSQVGRLTSFNSRPTSSKTKFHGRRYSATCVCRARPACTLWPRTGSG